MKTKNFENKCKVSLEEKILAHFFSVCLVWQTSKDVFQESKRCFDNYCGSYKFISVTPKRLLKTQIFEEKATFPVQKKFNCFFSFYRVWKSSRSFLWWSTRYSDNHCASCKIISATPKRLLKTQIFEKKAIFPVKKKSWLLLWQYRTWEMSGSINRGPECLLIKIAQDMRFFL